MFLGKDLAQTMRISTNNMRGIYDCQQGWSARVDWGKRRPAASETRNSFVLPRSGGTPLPPVIAQSRSGGTPLPPVIADNCSLRKAVFSCMVLFSILSAIASSRLSIPPEGVAFREIAAGEAASKSIELRNASSSPVAVSQVKGCCGADSERMSRWSKRNVFPSKIALGFMFAILGALVLPGLGAWLAELVGKIV